MKHVITILTLALVSLCSFQTAPADDEEPPVGSVSHSTRDSVIVQSMSVAPGDTNVVIGVRIVNSMPLMGLTVPLELRAVTPGAFITSIALGFRERMKNALLGARFTNHYAEKNTECLDSGTPAFRDMVGKGVDVPVPVTGSPWAVLMSAFRFPPSPSLPTGSDSDGSLTLTVGVTTTTGTFEIDTACIYPTNHLMLVGEHAIGELSGLMPIFVKGVITIGRCDCRHHGDINGDGVIDALDYSLLMDHVFFGGAAPPKDSSCPHVNRGDINCDGIVDIRDILHLREHMYGSGAVVCDPCACRPYPTDCP